AIACLGLGHLFLNQGAWSPAIDMLARGLALCQNAPTGLLLPAIAAALGYAYAMMERHAEALTLLEQVQQPSPLRTPLSSLVVEWLSAALLHMGRLEDGRLLAARALTWARQRQECGNEARALYLMGELAWQSPRCETEQATLYYKDAMTRAHALGM